MHQNHAFDANKCLKYSKRKLKRNLFLWQKKKKRIFVSWCYFTLYSLWNIAVQIMLCFLQRKNPWLFPVFVPSLTFFLFSLINFFWLNNEGRKVTLYCIALIQSFLNGKPFWIDKSDLAKDKNSVIVLIVKLKIGMSG